MPCRWSKGFIRYLGILVGKFHAEMLEGNIMSLITQIQEKCASWGVYSLSLFSRIAAIKMFLLPKILFVCLNAALTIPVKILNTFQDILNRFLWGYKRACIHSRILVQKLELGGLAVPDIAKYYYALVVTMCLDGDSQITQILYY